MWKKWRMLHCRALLLGEPAEKLQTLIDIPWCRADEFYIQKLALTLAASRNGTCPKGIAYLAKSGKSGQTMKRRLPTMDRAICLTLLLELICTAATTTADAAISNICDTPLVGERWETRSTAIGPREMHTAVWSGSEMLA